MRKVRRFSVLLPCLALAAVGARATEPVQDEPAASAPAVEEGVEVIPPQIIIKTQKAPEYPPAAFEARFSGVVTVEVTVLRDGKVDDDVRVVECTHKRVGFEEAAIAAVKQWRFEPAIADGEPVEFTRTFRLTFHGTGAGAEIGPYVTAGTEPPSEGPSGSAARPSRDSTVSTRRK